MFGEAKNFIFRELERRSHDAGTRVLGTAGRLKTIAGELRSDDLSRVAAPYVDRGVSTLESAGNYLSSTKGDVLFAQAEAFARERPWAAVIVGLAGGIAGARIVKSAGDAESAYGSSSRA